MLPRLLFIYQKPTSFVLDDLHLLAERYDVRPFEFGGATTGIALLGAIRRQARWMAKEMPAASAVFGWFADYHLTLPFHWSRRHNKPFLVVLAGYDCVRLPELNYGVYQSRWRAPLARSIVRRATLLLPVAEALMGTETAFATWPTVRPQGIQAHVPRCSTPFDVIPTAYDPEAWPLGPMDRTASVCSVALIESERTFRLKGMDLLVEAARNLPDVSFQVVGVAPGLVGWIQARWQPPETIRWLPPRPREALADVYAHASAYVQLSRSEGLPNALCEAMLSGCIPVVSSVGAMPDALGELGEVVDRPDPRLIADALRRALGASPEQRTHVRSRIIQNYSPAHRRHALFEQIDRLTAGS